MIVDRPYCLPPPGPIPRSAAVMRNGDDADCIDLQPVDDGIREAVKSQCPCIACTGFTQFGEPAQQVKRLIDLINKIIRCSERAFPDIPIDGSMGVGVRLVAKIDPH